MREHASSRRADPLWVRDVLVVVMTLVTGASDAVGFTRLGGVFTSVMTGNMVLLGVSAGRRDASLAIHTGVAFLCYIGGAIVGGRVAGSPVPEQSHWPRRITVALVLELALFVAFGVGWELAGAAPAGSSTFVLLGICAVALGLQSSAVLRFGVSGLSTTYLTGTLTTVIAGLTTRDRSVSYVRSVSILAALICGAAIGAAFALEVPRLAPLVLVGPLAAVVAIASVRWRDERA